MNRPATKTSTRDTYLASSGSEIFILAKNLSQDPLFVVIGFLLILSTSSEFSTGHAFPLFKLIYDLFLIIFLLFASLDTSGTFNVNRPTTKTSTRDTYLASLGLKMFILAKNWSQDPLFVVIGFLTILSTSSEFSIGHAFHLFKLILALFLIIFLLFVSLDTSGTWYMNRPATKTSTRDTYSSSLGSKNFILAKTSHKILFSL